MQLRSNWKMKTALTPGVQSLMQIYRAIFTDETRALWNLVQENTGLQQRTRSHTRTCTHTHTHTRFKCCDAIDRNNVKGCSSKRVHAHTRTCAHTQPRTCAHTLTHTHTCVDSHTHKHTHAHTHTHTHTRSFIGIVQQLPALWTAQRISH